MAKLTAKEADLLKKLNAKAEAPDAPASSRVLNVSIDLADEAQVARAQKLGLLSDFDDDDGDGDGDDGDGDGDDPPNRRGYFDE